VEAIPRQHVDLPRTITLLGQDPVKLPLQFHFKHVLKDYEMAILLRDKFSMDVRRFMLRVNVLPKPTLISL
jgi:hypothetical protein